MCLIIAPGKDGAPALLPRDVFDYAYDRNKDGFGAMWVEDGRVQHFKTLGLSADTAYEKMEALIATNPEAIFHLRYKTHGKIIPGLSHPFRILHKNRHGKDLFFMHNGVFGGFGNNLLYGQSDTTRFKDKILVPLLTRDPDALDDPEIWEQINKLTSGSRLVFMDSEGKTYFTNENTWNNRYGLTLSNSYMLPPASTTTNHNRSAANTDYEYSGLLSGEVQQVTGHYIYYRLIDKAGEVSAHWCSCPKIGYLRTESGLLYKDNGANKKIYHAVNFIPKDQEFKHLGLILIPSAGSDLPDVGSAVMEDDTLPWDDEPFEPSYNTRTDIRQTSSGPAPEDQRLRYARMMNNVYAGQVASRIHLMADLVGMGDKELASFVDEDPETASTVLAELIEMVIEYNDTLWAENPNNKMILNSDEIIRIGQVDYHRDAIKEVSSIRRQAYEAQIKKFNEILDTPEGEVHVA